MKQIVFIYLIFYSINAFSQNNDTLYFDRDWKICEKPRAAYFRLGQISMDSGLFYKGPVKDLYINGNIQMEGTYDNYGKRKGLFKNYYSNGNIQSEGLMTYNLMYGDWHYFYSNGDSMANIYISGPPNEFIVTDFYDSSHKKTLSDSTGSFYWTFYDNGSKENIFVTGEFLKGKRNGIWKYYKPSSINGLKNFLQLSDLNINEQPTQTPQYLSIQFADTNKVENRFLQFEEHYKDGQLTEGIQYSLLNPPDTYKKEKNILDFTQEKFFSIQAFSYDIMLSSEHYYLDDKNLINYLKDRQAISFYIQAFSLNDFLDSADILANRELKTQTYMMHEFEKDYNSQENFILKPDGSLNNFSFTGNLSDDEKKDFEYVFSKFHWVIPANLKNQISNIPLSFYIYTTTLNNKSKTEKPDKMITFDFVPPQK